MNTNKNKLLLALLLFVFTFAGCNSTPTQIQTDKTTPANKENTTMVAAHTTENQPPANSNSGGSPMSKPVDVTKLTEEIEKAEKEFKAKPKDETAKSATAKAYFERAFALTKAAQYSAALGDFRKGLKLNPDDKEAKGMMDQIVSIYESMGRPVPKEGEEKAPMPIEK